jgi:hypothetical protein
VKLRIVPNDGFGSAHSPAAIHVLEKSLSGYEPRRPDFMEVAGGLSARTTGGVGTCCGIFVLSGTLCGWEFFFFFEKSGMSFFRFI